MDLERDRVVVFEDPERIEKPSLRSDFWSKKGRGGGWDHSMLAPFFSSEYDVDVGGSVGV